MYLCDYVEVYMLYPILYPICYPICYILYPILSYILSYILYPIPYPIGTMNQVSQYIALKPTTTSNSGNKESLINALSKWTVKLLPHS